MKTELWEPRRLEALLAKNPSLRPLIDLGSRDAWYLH